MKKVIILGVEISDVSRAEAWGEVKSLMLDQNQHYITTPNPEIVLKARKDRALRHIINNSDLALPDGFGLKLGAKILGQELNNRIAGADFMVDIVRLAEKEEWPIFLLGGTGDTVQKAAERLKKFFPNLAVSGFASGGEIREENGQWTASDKNLVDNINSSGAQILFVGFGAPKQEKWLYDNLAKLETVKLAMTVGGSLDYLSGQAKRAPLAWRQAGWEWLWRLIREPKRIKRIWNAVVVFLYQVMRWRLRIAHTYRKNVAGFIFNNKNEVLIVERATEKYEHWQLPQGGVNKGENEEQAVLREMREEVGATRLQIIGKHPQKYTYDWSPWHQRRGGYKGQCQTIFYLRFDHNNDKIAIDEKEIKNYQWANLDKVVSIVHPLRRGMTEVAVEGFKKLRVSS